MRLRHLAQVERHIALGKRQIAKQKAIIAHVEAGGLHAAIAREVLQTLLATQLMHEDHCAKILRELTKWPAHARLVEKRHCLIVVRRLAHWPQVDVMYRRRIKRNGFDYKPSIEFLTGRLRHALNDRRLRDETRQMSVPQLIAVARHLGQHVDVGMRRMNIVAAIERRLTALEGKSTTKS